MLTFKQFKQLRGEVVFNSLYIKDYDNSFGIDPIRVWDFFGSYLADKMNIFLENNPSSTPEARDDYFNSIIDKNDVEDMYAYYLSLDVDYLSLPTATLDGETIKMIARWGKNGRKYVWIMPTQKTLDKLVEKYGIDQIASGQFKNENGEWISCNCLWLED